MKSFKTLEQAKKEIEILQHYVELVEKAPSKTLKEFVVKEYALQGNLSKVAGQANLLFPLPNGELHRASDIAAIITEKGHEAPLDKLIRSCYLMKTRHARKRKLF